MDIVINHLTKTYGDQKAVDDLSFSVKTGEILGFLGPNGAGKTTTMKAIAGFLEIESGDIQIGHQSVNDNADALRKHIGYLPENNPLYEDMAVIDYLEFCAELQGISGYKKKQRVKEMVGLCGINKEKHKQIAELSKGYRQRVGLAQAMIHDPEILILDEPTTGLDPNQIVEIRKLIKDLGKEKTVILSTHILPEVEATCDRILIINRGRIVGDGTADSLKQQASGQQIHHFQLVGKNVLTAAKELRNIPGILSVNERNNKENDFEVHSESTLDFPKELFGVCQQHNCYIRKLTPFETSLEDIFRGLTI